MCVCYVPSSDLVPLRTLSSGKYSMYTASESPFERGTDGTIAESKLQLSKLKKIK